MRLDPRPLVPGLLIVIACCMTGTGCTSHPSTPISEGTSEETPELVNVSPPDSILTPEPRGRFYQGLRPETESKTGEDFDVDVSPSGDALAFSSTRFSKEAKIFVRDIEKGTLYQKTSGPGRDIQPKYSPDGEWIAFASNRSGNYDILIVPTQRQESTWQLTQSDGDELHPTWSPDGKRIAYSARSDDGEWLLWIVELDSQRRTQLGPGLNPEWSPDGESLVFQRPSRRGSGLYGIWVVSVSGGSPREVATHPEHGYVQPVWSPDSSRIACALVSSPTSDVTRGTADDIWIFDLEKHQQLRLTVHASPDYSPSWGLDGRIYFTSHRSGVPCIWSLEPARTPEFGTDEDALGELPRGTHR